MSSLSLNIGLKSLLAAQASLETIGHNLANASTPGYSRQSLHVSASPTLRLGGLLQGTGIQADVIQRTVDALLASRIVLQTASLGRLDARLDAMSDAESFLGGSSATGMNALLEKYFAGLSTLSTAPDDPLLRGNAVQSALELSSRFNQVAAGAHTLRRDTLLRLDAQVDQVNVLAREIGDLNRSITSTEAGNMSANDLRDRRDEAVRQLSQLVDARVVDDAHGSVRVLVSGNLLVSSASVQALSLATDPATGAAELRLGQNPNPIEVRGGAIGGLLQVLQGFLPGFSQDFDALARGLILETNRVHSTGIPLQGTHHLLVGSNALQDENGSGSLHDDLLAQAGLPFDVASGELHVNVLDEATGALEKHVLSFDRDRTTVGQFLAQLNAIGHVSASLDPQGRLQVSSDTGFGFDFSARLDPDPDPIGSFGGGRASLATAQSAPFALSAGDTLDLVGPLGPFTVTLAAGSFQQIGAATASELAAALNADPNVSANGLVATAVGDQLVLQTVGAGAGESFSVAGGSALGALGWSAGTSVSGHAHAVSTTVSGRYDGPGNDVYTFRPNMDGTIGATAGLQVAVFDAAGAQVALLDVGLGYAPGTTLDVAHGVQVQFSLGELSQTDGDVFRLDLVADSDTTDLLPALGLNSLFTGFDAATIDVRADIQQHPELFSASATGAPGDGTTVLALLALENRDIAALGGLSLGERYGGIAGDIGVEIASAASARESEQFLLDSLTARREQISGVNVDEEMVRMIEQEQAYAAASQFIGVVNRLNDELLQLI